MVNRFKKRLWFLLVVFLVYLISPGYPDSKKKKIIHNLPVNQDMGTQSWRYSEGGEKIELKAMKQDDCSDCWGTLDDAIRCRYCVELKGGCKDCCFSGEDPDSGIIKCTEADGDDYKCKSELFDRDDCEQVVCDADKCNTKCTDYTYDADSPCKSDEVKGKETGGAVDASVDPIRWQRKGCPEEDSEGLAPDAPEENCKEVSGAGLERVWECDEPGYSPEFSGCNLTAEGQKDLGRSKPTGYYSVTRVDTSCDDECKIVPCSPNCGSSGACKKNASCFDVGCEGECKAFVSGRACVSNCSSADTSSWADCEPPSCQNSGGSCSASCKAAGGSCESDAVNCSVACSKSSQCSPHSGRWAESPNTFYVYTLSDDFKNYINECIDYADKYDDCLDRVNCCQKGVCQDISVKNKEAGQYDCVPGSLDNCKEEDCQKRKCYHYKNHCDEFTSIGAKKSCPGLASDVHGCLTLPKNSGCFKEVEIKGEPFHYPYVASSNDALNIIWQITSTSSDKDVKGLNFYTLVKVFKLDSNGNPEGDPVHTSMANVKSQEAAFSIYGTTNVPKGVRLKEGVSYGVYLYYSLPPGEFCDEECEGEACKNGATIELTYVSLILQRVRE